ncbi:hypothetical protein BS17DRAFT_672679, partial [Gyrodon lividus]
KKQNQWHWWSQDIIPALIEPYLNYLRRSNSLQTATQVKTTSTNATCMCDRQCLFVTCIFFDRLEDVQVNFCKCTPAPVHLINHGLFACSPITPLIAVNLCVLELVKNLFARLAPNTMAWCDTLESFSFL